MNRLSSSSGSTWLVLVVCFFLFLPAYANDDVPEILLASESISEDGHVKVQWQLAKPSEEVEVEMATEPGFEDGRVIYAGPDNATFISGLENGDYYIRVRKPDYPWSDPVKVTVKHHSLELAFTLFGLGAIVFLLTVFVVVKGAMQTNR